MAVKFFVLVVGTLNTDVLELLLTKLPLIYSFHELFVRKFIITPMNQSCHQGQFWDRGLGKSYLPTVYKQH
jgi:hypothetical protein